ncbi:MAG: GreA/GreB family elongation factor [Thermoanaerobaculales bacterium]
MSEYVAISQNFTAALEDEDWERVEELWLEALEESPIPTSELLEVRRRLWKSRKKTLARTLLELLAESLEASGSPKDALVALREQARLAEPKPSQELLERLVGSFSTTRAHLPSLSAVLDRHPITTSRHPLEELEKAECWLDHDRGTVVEVIGQGVGRVTDLNLELENIKVDLGGSRPVSVPFGAVRRFLRPLPDGDFRRQKVEDPDALAEFVANDPGEALAQLLDSLGEAADVAAIKNALDGVLDASRWTSWWAKARKHSRIVTSGSGSRLRYSVSLSAEIAGKTLLEDLKSATPAERLKIARRLADRGPEGAEAAADVLTDSLGELAKSDPGLAWQTAGILVTLPGGRDSATECRTALLANAPPLELLSGCADRSARTEALEALADAHPESWSELWGEWLLHEESVTVLNLLSSRLIAGDQEDVLDRAIEAIYRNHVAHAPQFVWLCETMTESDCPEVIRQRMTPSLLEKLPDTLTRGEFSALRARAKSLLDGGRVAIRLLVEAANPQQASRFSQRIARITTVEPQRAHLVEQAALQRQEEPTEHLEPVLVATREALEAKREELRLLLEVEIPKTLKGINAAAAEGDLRENFEYHMLRDRQELQSARAAKLQEEFATVRILEPGAADPSIVNIGTVVHLKDSNGTDVAPITILGAWDADPDRRIFANGTEFAQTLLGKKPGDEVELPDGRATITRIEAWTT